MHGRRYYKRYKQRKTCLYHNMWWWQLTWSMHMLNLIIFPSKFKKKDFNFKAPSVWRELGCFVQIWRQIGISTGLVAFAIAWHQILKNRLHGDSQVHLSAKDETWVKRKWWQIYSKQLTGFDRGENYMGWKEKESKWWVIMRYQHFTIKFGWNQGIKLHTFDMVPR